MKLIKKLAVVMVALGVGIVIGAGVGALVLDRYMLAEDRTPLKWESKSVPAVESSGLMQPFGQSYEDQLTGAIALQPADHLQVTQHYIFTQGGVK